MIRPLGIAEIGRAIGKDVGLQWIPGAAGQVCAGFDNDRDVRCPRDNETEPVGLRAKAQAAVQDQRVRKPP